MGYFNVKELKNGQVPIYNVQKFLFSMIMEEYGYGFVPEYHGDIVNIGKYYLKPGKNNFFMAQHNKTGELMGTIGIRAYDKKFPLKNVYTPETTAGIWRVFVDKNWRRNGVASTLVRCGEQFCREKGYEKIYLHTHKSVIGALDFWLSHGYRIVEDTGNELKTVHMDKKLI